MAVMKVVEQKKHMMKCVCMVREVTLSGMCRKDLKRNYAVLGKPLRRLGNLVHIGMRIEATISNLQGRECVVLNPRDFK